MKNLLTTALLIGAFFYANSQTDKNVEDHQFSINILLPGVVYEAGISNNTTLTSELAFGFQIRESDFFEDGFGVYPIARFQYRNYYNLQRRLLKGKRIDGNTGNYVAPTFAYQGGNAIAGNLDLVSNYFLAVGAVYGIQRTAPKGFQFRLEAGPAYLKDQFGSGFGVFLAAKIAWVIRKRK